jgi:hydroxymethylpyrimidine pyrophosphatase-like HAD family hydrolase
MDGTLLGSDSQISPRNHAALLAAEAAGIEVVIATGRRHSYAMRILRPLGLHHAGALISSNGTVTRTVGSFGAAPIASQLITRTHLSQATTLWLCGHLDEYRNALVLTFDRVGSDGDDTRGALVVEHLDELNTSIGRWMAANEPYIAHINPIEQALAPNALDDLSNPSDPMLNTPIQAMLCGTVERMAQAEARLLEHPGVQASDHASGRSGKTVNATPGLTQIQGAPLMTVPSSWVGSTDIAASHPIITLHRTVYPDRDLSILDILPPNCSKGAAILSHAATRNIDPSEILAIGDNWNDVSMLEIAGHAVLMDNAPEDLKAIARTSGWSIGLANTADGVAEAIESLLTVACL